MLLLAFETFILQQFETTQQFLVTSSKTHCNYMICGKLPTVVCHSLSIISSRLAHVDYAALSRGSTRHDQIKKKATTGQIYGPVSRGWRAGRNLRPRFSLRLVVAAESSPIRQTMFQLQAN